MTLTGCHRVTAAPGFMGRDCSGSVCFVFPYKSWWERGIYQLRCLGNGVVAGQRVPRVSALAAVCMQSVGDWAKRQHPPPLHLSRWTAGVILQ